MLLLSVTLVLKVKLGKTSEITQIHIVCCKRLAALNKWSRQSSPYSFRFDKNFFQFHVKLTVDALIHYSFHTQVTQHFNCIVTNRFNRYCDPSVIQCPKY